MKEPTIVSITGGAGGLVAKYDDMETLADDSDRVGGMLASATATGHRILADPDVLASALLDPVGFAHVEQQLLEALDGPGGALAISVRLSERSAAVRLSALTYRATDWAQHRALQTLQWIEGYEGPGAILVAILAKDPSLAHDLYVDVMNGHGVDWERLVVEHPGVVDEAVNAGPGLITGLTISGSLFTPWITPMFVGSVTEAAGLLGSLYPDGRPKVTYVGVETSDFFGLLEKDRVNGSKQPRLERVARALNQRNDASSADQSEITVRKVTHPDGSVAYVVDIPGTKLLNLPGATDTLTDMGTNFRAIAGETTSYEKAVAAALAMAGAPVGAPVLLVGHSQGGIVAMQAAHDAADGTFPYEVTHVVTFGAPVDRIAVPDTIQVLNVENSHDVVAHLDGGTHVDAANRTTVTFDGHTTTVGGSHALDVYEAAAREIDTSSNPSTVRFLDSMSGYLDPANTSEASIFQVSREF